MDILDFFAGITTHSFDETSVTYVVAKTYQPIFLETLQCLLEKRLQQKIQKVSQEATLTDVQRLLTTSFLGQQHWYLLMLCDVASAKQDQIIQFIKKYDGPHRLVVILSDELYDSAKINDKVYRLADTYTYDQVKKCAWLYDGIKPEVMAYVLNKLFKLHKAYSLEQLCLLKEYAMLLGSSIDQFFEQWFEKLIVQDASLFYVSQLFFEKKSTLFFEQWKRIRKLYSDQFWTAFFSEQLFKAYFYVQMQGKLPADQKQIAFGLPFSFLKQDWKRYTASELAGAHEKIYDLDLALKNGASQYCLDLFCISFLDGLFV